MLINPKKAAAAVLALLLLLAACSPAKEGSSSAPAETSAPPSESLEYEGEHDHTGIPGLDLPESLPVGDYAFEAYDSSEVQVTSMIFTVNGEMALWSGFPAWRKGAKPVIPLLPRGAFPETTSGPRMICL